MDECIQFNWDSYCCANIGHSVTLHIQRRVFVVNIIFTRAVRQCTCYTCGWSCCCWCRLIWWSIIQWQLLSVYWSNTIFSSVSRGEHTYLDSTAVCLCSGASTLAQHIFPLIWICCNVIYYEFWLMDGRSNWKMPSAQRIAWIAYDSCLLWGSGSDWICAHFLVFMCDRMWIREELNRNSNPRDLGEPMIVYKCVANPMVQVFHRLTHHNDVYCLCSLFLYLPFRSCLEAMKSTMKMFNISID